jgi:uncharacterized membrane protein YfcA
MNMKSKRKRRRETSKVALAGILIFCGIAFIIVLVGWLCGMDDAATILAIIAGIAVLIVRYYMQKAQAENLIKIRRANKYTDDELNNLMELASHGTKSDEE